jgi:hypothetical protein
MIFGTCMFSIGPEGRRSKGRALLTDRQLTHIDEKGDVRMVDVSQKADYGAR